MRFPFGIARIVWTFTAVLLGVMLYIVPMVESTFRDFKVELPLATKAMLATSRLLKATYLWVPIAGVAIALPFVIAAMSRQDDADYRTRMRAIMIILYLVGIAATVWVVFGLFVPYTSMITSLTGGK